MYTNQKHQKLLTLVLRPTHIHKDTIYHNELQAQCFSRINHDLHKIKLNITHFFNKIKITETNTIIQINPLIIQLIIPHQKTRNLIIKIINDSLQINYFTLTTLINQIILNHIHEMSRHDNQEIIQRRTIIFFNHKTQSMHNLTNQLKWIEYLQQHEKTKSQITNLSQIPNAAASLQMTMNLYLMG